ncbi:protein kinase [Pseudovibrio sp. Tun.PSC04-5.I4]|uniref:protein kinase domain-containing protein n=1 Tax=Pseudovibrio sp. Tun.PSC04-5.I4 TaxID=1798213 RepID=UPI00088A2B84|nr:protein kinase [Pseudovibrio sp. Tun.PSC04-5.I4]SDR48831.1 Protein kinase domain-containing protein [Pseudovibrio sp. Tun.PSC04-5.I4]
MVRENDNVPEEANDPSHPEHDQWVTDVAKALNIDLAAAQDEPLIAGSVQMQDMSEPQAQQGDIDALPEFEREASVPLHRELNQRTRRETPPDNSPIRVSDKPDGTMVIDAASVPSAFEFGGLRGRNAGALGNHFRASEHAMDVTGKLGPPIIGGAANAANVLAFGATGVLQDYPHIENAVIKRPNTYSNGPDQPLTFIGAEMLIHEAKILTALSHFDEAKGSKNVLKVKGSGLTEFGEPFVITEKLTGGSLDARLPDDKGMDEEPLNDFADGLLAGVAFLQKRNIFHQDLKADNILFRDPESTEPIIIDFDAASAHEGIAADCEDGQHFNYEIGGAPNIQPPERFKDGEHITGKVDSWAGGLLLVAAASGKTSQQALIDELQIFRNGSSNDQAQLDEKVEGHLLEVPENIKGAIKGLLKLSPEERLSAEQALDIVNMRAA